MIGSRHSSPDFPWLDHVNSRTLRHLAQHNPDRYGALIPQRAAQEQKTEAKVKAEKEREKDPPIDGSMGLLNATSISFNEMGGDIRKSFHDRQTPYGGRDPAMLRRWNSHLAYASQDMRENATRERQSAPIYAHMHPQSPYQTNQPNQSPNESPAQHLAAIYAAKAHRAPGSFRHASM